MPITKSAEKALRQAERRTIINQKAKKALKRALSQMGKKPNRESLKKAFSQIDKAVKRNLLHSNKAARLKSRLARSAQERKASSATKKKPAGGKSPRAKMGKRK